MARRVAISSASSELGRATAMAFLAQGAEVLNWFYNRNTLAGALADAAERTRQLGPTEEDTRA